VRLVEKKLYLFSLLNQHLPQQSKLLKQLSSNL